MTSTSQITVAELVSLDSNRGINFTGPYPPTYNGANFGVGATGANGLNNATVFMYASTDTSTPPLTPVSVLTYAFATGLVTGSSGAWATQFPTDNKPYRWVIKYVAVSANATYAIQPSDWSAASLMSKDGTAGYNIARLYIYQRVTEGQTPSPPNADTTFTFATNTLTGLTNGWLYLIPLGSDPLWISSATAISYSATDTITAVEWSNPVILVKNGTNGTTGNTGDPGTPGDKSVTVNLYYWSTTQPTGPTGTTTYTWATGVHSGSAGSWTTSVQTNSGVPGLKLWSVTKTITVPYNSVTSSVSWSGDAVSPISQNGTGFRSVEASVFKWSASLPTGPIGTGTYDWTGNSLTSDPASSPGWHIAPNNSDMAAGFTLWKASVFLQDSQAATQTSFNWTSATSILAVGYAGAQGPAGSTDLGAQGASARIAYKKYSAGTSPSGSPDPYTIAGDTLPPANTWDSTGVSWSTSVPTLGANEFLYQTNGVYNPATTQTAWSAPYQTSFKVGSLSALSANMGTITSGSLTLDTSGFIKTAGASYGSGSGIWMGYTGGTYKISIGGLTYDGTTLSVPAASITGQLNAGQINTNGLTIRDASGNVILGAGASVNPSSYISVPAGWQNSNISLSSTGTLTSSGTNLGAVTASGLGAVKTDLSNAPTAIQNSQITLTQSGNTYSLANAGGGSTISIGGLGYTGDLNATSDLTLIATGNGVVSGNTIKFPGANWGDGAGYSKDGYAGGAYVSGCFSGGGQSMLALNRDPTTNSHYNSLDLTLFWNGSNMYAGWNDWSSSQALGVGANPNDVFAIVVDDVNVRWLKNGVLLLSKTIAECNQTTGITYYVDSAGYGNASITNIKFGPLSSNNWGSIGGAGKPQDNATVGATLGSNVYDSYGSVVSSDAVKNNLIDLSWWKPNATIPWHQNNEQNILGAATNWTNGDPKGGSDTVWFAREIGGDGNNGGGWDGQTLNLDPSKTYRFVVPVKNLTGDGSIFWGTINVCDLNTTNLVSTGGGPYFVGGYPKASMYTDRWYLMVGFVYPAGSTGMNHNGAGLIDCTTGAYIGVGLNFCFSAASGNVSHRAYQFYASGTGATVLFGRPIVNLVDGTEPALSNFFSSTAMLNQSISVNPGTGAISGIGTGSGTVVANSSIGISGGNLTGIGTGNNTPVANSNITVSNSSNSYTINGIGSSGAITISGLGYSGDLNATRGAPSGTTVGSTTSDVVATASNNYNNQVQSIDLTGGSYSQNYFYPVIVSNSSIGGAIYYDFTVFRSNVHEDSSWLCSYSCQVIARSYAYGHAPGKLIEVNQAGGGPGATYTSGVSDVYVQTGSSGILVMLRGGMHHHISMSQPIGPYTVVAYPSGYSDGVAGTINPTTTGALLSYLNKSYCPDSPVDWSSSISGSTKPDDNATRGAPAGTPVAGNFPSGNSAATTEANITTALNRGQNALDNRLAKATADTLTGPITLNAASAILVGTTNDGLYLGNTGIVGRKAGVTTFAVDQYGNATFKGDISGSNGIFSGTLAANTVTTENLVIGSVTNNSSQYLNGFIVYSGANTSSFNKSDFGLFNLTKGSGSASVVSTGSVRVFCSSFTPGNVISISVRSYFSWSGPISLGDSLYTYIYKNGDSGAISVPVNLTGILLGGMNGYPAETYSIRITIAVSSYSASTGNLISNMYYSDADIRSYYVEMKV